MLRLFSLLFLALTILGVSAQTPDARRLQTQILRANRSSLYMPQEKVYLHFDNTGYFQGETIHFKAYMLRSDTQCLSDLSHVLYVDLLTPNGQVVERRKLKLEGGTAAGDFRLDHLLLSGFYEVRAYTRYMTNWGTEACFSRVFPVFERPREIGDYSNKVLDQISHRKRLLDLRGGALSTDSINGQLARRNTHGRLQVHFYPEGGQLVRGLESRVAYTVLDGDSEVVRSTLQVCPRDLTPLTVRVDRESYQLTLTEGGRDTYELPAIAREGVVMTLDGTHSTELAFRLAASDSLKSRVLGYALMHQGVISRADTVLIGEGQSLTFCRDSLPAGVSQLTVFTPAGQILAERLFWICPQPDALDTIRITTPTRQLKPCRKVAFDLQTVPYTNLSFAAIDAATMTGGIAGDARTHLLLSSELRGYIAHPSYYLESDDTEHRQAADLLMMVQGWRKYDWQLYNGLHARQRQEPIEDRLALYGRILPRRGRQKVENTLVKATMYNREGQVLEGEFTTDSDGKYLFDLPDIDNDWTLLMTSEQEEKKKNYIISIDRHFSPATRSLDPLETQTIPVPRPTVSWSGVPVSDEAEIPLIHVGDYLLDEIVVKKRATNWTKGWSDETDAKASSMLYFDCDAITEQLVDEGKDIPGFDEWLVSLGDFDGTDYTSDPADVTLTGYYAVDAEGNQQQQSMQFYKDGMMYRRRPILWIIDNMFWGITSYRGPSTITVQYHETFLSNVEFPPFLDDVRSVYISEEVQSSHNHFQSSEVDAIDPVVLYVYTHRTVQTKVKGLRRTHYQGFNVPTVFQMDDYSILPPMDDFRRTLYWSPVVHTDADGKAHVEFWNNSSCQEMYLSVEGVSRDGRIQVNQK